LLYELNVIIGDK